MRDGIFLTNLQERTSSAGNRYLRGRLGKATIIAHLDRDSAETVWQLFITNGGPADRDGTPRPNSATRRAAPVDNGEARIDATGLSFLRGTAHG